MEVVTDIVTPNAEVAIDFIQLVDPDVPLSDDKERLRQLIWRKKHLLIDKRKVLPPAARGATCDRDRRGTSEPDRTDSTASSAQTSRKTSGFDQRTSII